jgi:hypothetical protein
MPRAHLEGGIMLAAAGLGILWVVIIIVIVLAVVWFFLRGRA